MRAQGGGDARARLWDPLDRGHQHLEAPRAAPTRSRPGPARGRPGDHEAPEVLEQRAQLRQGRVGPQPGSKHAQRAHRLAVGQPEGRRELGAVRERGGNHRSIGRDLAHPPTVRRGARAQLEGESAGPWAKAWPSRTPIRRAKPIRRA
jgi:hypothetical protein